MPVQEMSVEKMVVKLGAVKGLDSLRRGMGEIIEMERSRIVAERLQGDEKAASALTGLVEAQKALAAAAEWLGISHRKNGMTATEMAMREAGVE